MDPEKGSMAVVGSNEDQEEKREWSEMPEEIVEIFMTKLTTFEEKVRFGSVCKAWNPIAPDKPSLWSPEPPWLITNDETSPNLQLYRVSDRKLFNIEKPLCIYPRPANGNGLAAGTADIVGSLMGWLFLRTSRPRSDKLTVLNPFSNRRLDLPSHCTYPPASHHNMNRLAFSISTCPNMNPTTIAMVTSAGCLAWCNPGDKAWRFQPVTMKQHQEYCYGNLLLHDDKLYAVDPIGRKVDIFRFEDGKKKKLVQVGSTGENENDNNNNNNKDDPWYVDAYMVECGGRVLVVRRYYLRYSIRPTSEWDVMEVNERESPPRLEVVRNLGDHILFVGDSSCESVAAHLCPALSPNCIYFTSFLRNSLVSHLGEFSLARSRITRRLPLNSPVLLYSPLWLMPRLPFYCQRRRCHCWPMIISRTTNKKNNNPSSTTTAATATAVVGARRSKRKLSTTTSNAAE